jgi:hypothetical protein
MVAWGCLGTKLGMDLRRLTFPIPGSQTAPTEGVGDGLPVEASSTKSDRVLQPFDSKHP